MPKLLSFRTTPKVAEPRFDREWKHHFVAEVRVRADVSDDGSFVAFEIEAPGREPYRVCVPAFAMAGVMTTLSASCLTASERITKQAASVQAWVDRLS